MENEQPTASKGRVTKQGVRDLNYYGPRREKAVVAEPVAVKDVETTAKPSTGEVQ